MSYLLVVEHVHQVAGKNVNLFATVDVCQSIVAQLVSCREPCGDRVATKVHLFDQDVVDRLFDLQRLGQRDEL